MVQAGFPAGGALESANISVSVTIFSRAPSGRETVTGDADVLILRVVKYVCQEDASVTGYCPLHCVLQK